MEDQPIDVLCINCSEMVSADQVTSHSSRCQQVHPFVTSMENSEALRLLDFKIEKLRFAMQSTATTGSARADAAALASLTELAGKLLKSYGVSETSLQLAVEVNAKLAVFVRDFRGGTSAALYGERLKALAKEKEAELRGVLETADGSSLRSQLTQKNEEIGRLRRELEQLRSNTAHDAELEEVKSEVHISRQSSQSSVEPPKPALPKKSAAEVAKMTQDERKRYFFSQCLAIKFTFGAKSKAQFVKIPELYEKAVAQNVAVEDWPDFIRNEMASA